MLLKQCRLSNTIYLNFLEQKTSLKHTDWRSLEIDLARLSWTERYLACKKADALSQRLSISSRLNLSSRGRTISDTQAVLTMKRPEAVSGHDRNASLHTHTHHAQMCKRTRAANKCTRTHSKTVRRKQPHQMRAHTRTHVHTHIHTPVTCPVRGTNPSCKGGNTLDSPSALLTQHINKNATNTPLNVLLSNTVPRS